MTERRLGLYKKGEDLMLACLVGSRRVRCKSGVGRGFGGAGFAAAMMRSHWSSRVVNERGARRCPATNTGLHGGVTSRTRKGDGDEGQNAFGGVRGSKHRHTDHTGLWLVHDAARGCARGVSRCGVDELAL